MDGMEGSNSAPIGSWLRCYRCWSQELEVQVHYEGIHRIDPVTGERAEVVDEIQEAVVQCLDCMHDQPHLASTTAASSRSRTAGSGWSPARRGSRRAP